MKRIAILGSTGSIGTQTLDVVAMHPERFQVVGLAAGRNLDRLADQIRQFRPKWVAVADREAADALREAFPALHVGCGQAGMMEMAGESDADFVLTAVVGSLGLAPTLAAIRSGKTIGLANKETLVAAGELVMAEARRHGVAILPVDSEHSAIFQCLNGEPAERVARIILTASGGSFRDRRREELGGVTVDQALKHPNWSMGAKVTIDSATMANKGLEVIEAHWLFGVDYDRIEVLIHPESIVHSLVEFQDCSVMAQLGVPDMRVPIQYALTYPDRAPSPARPLDLTRLGTLSFRPMDMLRYPALQLAYDSGRAGGTAPAVFNAANEAAVQRFLNGEIAFLDIERIVAGVLERHDSVGNPDLEAILAADAWARGQAARIRL